MEDRLSRALSRATLYPVRSARLPRTGRMEIPAKYQELQQIANSAYTAVFAVKDRGKAGTVFAAKIMADRQKDGNEEVENLRALQNCEQVPRIVEVFHQDYQSILVMEYLAGGNLFERLSQPKYQLTENKCRLFLQQILDGVEFMHNAGIIHLNLTPYNIIFLNKNSDQGLKIINFGLSVWLGEEESHKLEQLQGSLEYLAPEVLRCQAVARPADLWSVGVILYMLLSGGVSPFYGGSRLRTMVAALRAQYDLGIHQLATASPAALDLVSRLLDPAPDCRPSAHAARSHRWLAGGLARSQTVIELETRWMKRCLARRRWYRALNTLRALRILREFSTTEYKEGLEARRTSLQLANLRALDSIEGDPAAPRQYSEYEERYEVVKQIGSGAFGSVHLVAERGSGELAAAKYLRQTRQAVRTEAAILAKLIQSASVVQLVALYESPLNSILVTEYLSGGDLVTRTASDDYCLTEERCQIFVKQIVRGLQFIHSQSIIHLDLKPFNVIFANPEDDYNLRIIDFGIAEQLAAGQNRVKVNMCGTLEFMSPEVLNCQFASPASDVWGVGAIAFLLVSGGVSPFWAGSRYRTMARILAADFSFQTPNFSLVSEQAREFITALLLLEPGSRLTAAACLRHPWLTHIGLQGGLSEREHWITLETAWMKGVLARRRWQRWFHAIRAMHRIRKLSLSSLD